MSRAANVARRRRVALVVAGVVLATTGAIGGAVQIFRTAAAETAPPTAERTEQSSAAAPLTTPAQPVVATDPATGLRRQRVGGPSDFPGSLGSAPAPALAAYQRAAVIMSTASDCGLEWTVLAAIGRVESGHGAGTPLDAPLDGRDGRGELPDTDLGKLDGNRTWDAPVGPMALLPSTWRSVAVDADDDGRRDPRDLDDAALGAAVLLCADGDLSKPAVLRAALTSYHRAPAFAGTVLALAARYRTQAAQVPPPPAVELPLPSLPDLCRCATRPADRPSPTRIAASAVAAPTTLVPPTDTPTVGGTGPQPSLPAASPSATTGPSDGASPSDSTSPSDSASPSGTPGATDSTSAATPEATAQDTP